MVARGTDIAVVARSVAEQVDTALPRVAGVLGTDITIITTEDAADQAFALVAVVPGGAGIAIITRTLLGDMEAPLGRVAQVLCTGVFIIADHEPTANAIPGCALVVQGADIVIIAGVIVVRVQASQVAIAAIVGAGILIVAKRCPTALAGPVQAQLT